jgi:hypothetical protein
LALISQGRLPAHHKYDDVIEQQRDYTRGDYDKILAYRTKIELEAIFDKVVSGDSKEIICPLKMLIDGAPGVGKTTLSRKINHMWAKGELRTLKQYWLVLLLHLRESAISKAKSIDDFFNHEDAALQLEVTTFVKERSGDGVLIIFDGFDELSSYERSEQSLFLDVCEGKVLPKCAVVITSRPYASRSIQELTSINRHVEVLGFTDKQVEMCIRQKLIDGDKAEELCTELKDRLDVASICQIPLNCAIVLYVYEQENYSLPRTLTELYELFILHSLKRFVNRTQKSRGAADRLEYLNRLPDPSSGHFKSLCSLAFKGLEEDKLVFSRYDMENVFLEKYQDFDIPILDLMTSAKSYSSRGAKDTYSFLHLTIQEFLAAYWASHYLTDAERLYFFKKYLRSNRFRMVLLFLSGLSELSFPDAHTIFNKGSWVRDHVHICHLLYESGNRSMYKYVSENCILSKSIEMSGSKFDALVVSQFIASSGCQWDLLQVQPEHMKIVHKVFSACTSESVSIRETLIIFSIAYYDSPATKDTTLSYFLESTLPDGPGDMDPLATTAEAFTKVQINIDYDLLHTASRNETIMKSTTELLTNLKLMDQLAQIAGVVVRALIHMKLTLSDYKYLIEDLSTAFLGPHALHRKHYTIILDFSPLSRLDSYVHNYDWESIKLLHDCCIQNLCFHYTILTPEGINNAAYILSRLSREISISILAHFQCTDQSSFQLEAFPAPGDFLNLISVHKSLQQLHLDVPGLSDLICTHFMTFKSVLFHNATLQRLRMFSGLIIFDRNQSTNEMELTTPTISNIPLKHITSLSITADECDQNSHFKQSTPATSMVQKGGARVLIVIRQNVMNKAPFYRIVF